MERSLELGTKEVDHEQKDSVITLRTGGRWHLNLHMNLLSKND